MLRLHRFGAGHMLSVGFDFEFPQHVCDPQLRRTTLENGPFLFAKGRDHEVAAVLCLNLVKMPVERPGVQERTFEIDWRADPAVPTRRGCDRFAGDVDDLRRVLARAGDDDELILAGAHVDGATRREGGWEQY